MSLILEALRKSEAERRRAQVPDLLAEPQAAVLPPATAAQRWPWLLLLAAIIAMGVWVLRASWAPGTPAAARIAPVGAMAIPALAPPAPTVAASPRPTQARPLVVAAPVVATPPPARAAVVAIAPAAPPAVAGPEEVSPAPAAPPVTPPPAAAPGAPDAPMRVADLDSEERKQLPPLKLSMHMWNEAPAQRFVIIDGTRLTIGEHIGAARVADITTEGVLLDWNGRLLKLPLR